MKVVMMLTQLNSEGHVLHNMGGEIAETFDNIEEAANWISNYLDWKSNFLGDMHFAYSRHGNALTWEAVGIKFIEAYDIAF